MCEQEGGGRRGSGDNPTMMEGCEGSDERRGRHVFAVKCADKFVWMYVRVCVCKKT